MKILALDCATEWVSAALWLDGECRERSAPPRRGLSEELLAWCASLLDEAGIVLGAVDLIAFGRGPGGFTGVRMATSLAQGLAWSSNRPVAPVSTLRAIAFQALARAPGAARTLVCQDARMNEVYWARYARGLDAEGAIAGASLVGDERLSAPEAVDFGDCIGSTHGTSVCVAAGSGFAAFPALADRWRLAQVASGIDVAAPLDCPPRARDIAALAALDGLAAAVMPADAAPVYLRDTVATPPTPRPA
jgi:tRNA threonylcarbamoyladenosine biosynthesis protein TsaB